MLTPAKLRILQSRRNAVKRVVPIFTLHFLLMVIAFGTKKIIPQDTIRKSQRQVSQAKLSFIIGVTFIKYHSSSSWKQEES